MNKLMENILQLDYLGRSAKKFWWLKAEESELKQEGGLMSLGGMEMDLRGGGFVPNIGGQQEKAG